MLKNLRVRQESLNIEDESVEAEAEEAEELLITDNTAGAVDVVAPEEETKSPESTKEEVPVTSAPEEAEPVAEEVAPKVTRNQT